MRPIRPKLVAPQITIAEEQEEFLPLVAAAVKHPLYGTTAVFVDADGSEHAMNTLVVTFRPSDEQRKRLADGEDLYIGLMVTQLPPLNVFVGADETAQCYGVEVER